MITHVFFDIGDVLFDENVPHYWLFHTILLTLRRHGKPVEYDTWNQSRIELAAAGPDPEAAIKGSLAAYCVSDDETDRLWKEVRQQYEEMRKPRPYGLLLDGMTPVLRDLKQNFKLGIVANQHPEIMDGLRDYGVDKLFETIVISEIVNLFKPDPAIFVCGLAAAGIDASQVIFVGDRPDNDILPAKSLGMGTVRLRRGVQYSHFNPSDPAMIADRVVESVSELAAAVRAVAVEHGSETL